MKVLDLSRVSRLEVVDCSGRSYSNWNVKNLRFDLQDEGQTLKIFASGIPQHTQSDNVQDAIGTDELKCTPKNK